MRRATSPELNLSSMEDSLPSSIPREFQNGTLLPNDELARWLKAVGRQVRIYAGCKLFPPGAIQVGDYSQIDEAVRIYAGQGVTIGRHVHLAFGSSISGGGRCLIDDFVGLGAGVRLITGTDLIDGESLTNPTVPAKYRGVHRGHVRVGSFAVLSTLR